jgi:hypothetical protein
LLEVDGELLALKAKTLLCGENTGVFGLNTLSNDVIELDFGVDEAGGVPRLSEGYACSFV